MDAVKSFLAGYWAYAQWYLLAIAAVSLVTMLVLRRRGRAFAILLLGVYVTMTAYFLSVREDMGYSLWTSLGIVVVLGLAVMVVLYYFVFIRTE